RRFSVCVVALGVAAWFSAAAIATDDKPNDIPGPIDSIQDLQDSARMLFKMADTNNDDQISQKEAMDVGNLLVGGFFFRADTNGDGPLTPEEARQAREALSQQQPPLRYILQHARATNPPGHTEPANSSAQPGTTNPTGPSGTTSQTGQVVRNLAAN